MRNWNVSDPLLCQAIVVPLPDYLWGIETLWSLWGTRLQYRFQTTYEELKRPTVEFESWAIWASRLPMRNWNTSWQIAATCSIVTLPDYLWGIETPVRSRPTVRHLWASRLPMRNWNSNGHDSQKTGRASRLPMRNWNISAHCEGLRWSRFQTTYEELKLSNV